MELGEMGVVYPMLVIDYDFGGDGSLLPSAMAFCWGTFRVPRTCPRTLTGGEPPVCQPFSTLFVPNANWW